MLIILFSHELCSLSSLCSFCLLKFTISGLKARLKGANLMATELIEKLLSSLNPSQKEIDKLWANEAEKRVEELRAGAVKAIPGEEVFREIRENLSVRMKYSPPSL